MLSTKEDLALNETVVLATAFIESLELPRPPRKTRSTNEGLTLDNHSDQALIVGSNIMAFAADVPASTREVVLNSSLFAQLAANHKYPNRADTKAWYDVYYATLMRIGWLTQEHHTSEHQKSGSDFQAHEAILSIAATLLEPAPAALAVVQSTLAALRSMVDSSAFTVFRNQTLAGDTAMFQVVAVDIAPDGRPRLGLMAFELHAKSEITQVLFFKHRSAEVTLRYSSSRLALNTGLIEALLPALAARIAFYTNAYVAEIAI